ncbi:type II secretion system F family protein [Aquibacillus sediminis]|uniref:type II secretion system F family protein n=1 Tax=Aquibacillus sediminis TaxID=2574734 RepID=UPI0011082B0E|nr:type II secretion system F family protein [Aquibacillus sediminis]
MAYFRYKGRDRLGKAKQGKISAESKQEAVANLKLNGVIVFQIDELNSILYKEIHFGKKVKHKDFVIFLRQFSTLIDAGVTLVEATTILQEQTDSKHIKSSLAKITEHLESGETLSQAMERYDDIYPSLLTNMIHAGEVSGNLDEILDNMATYYEKQNQLRQKIVTALTYPLTVGVFALLISIFLLTFIVPTFANMFTSMGEDLPAYTAFILGLSDFTRSYWWVLLLLVILAFILIRYLLSKPNLAYRLDVLKLKTPIFGDLLQKAVLARMTRTLSSLLNSSVPILQAVQIADRVITNRVVKKVLQDSQTSLEQGESLATPMKDHWVFTKMVTQMIAVGERSGSLDEMLSKVADFYEEELDHATDKIKSLIEPIMIVILTVIVGAIVLAIIIPMFSLFENI